MCACISFCSFNRQHRRSLEIVINVLSELQLGQLASLRSSVFHDVINVDQAFIQVRDAVKLCQKEGFVLRQSPFTNRLVRAEGGLCTLNSRVCKTPTPGLGD